METIKIGIGTSSIGRFLPYVAEAAGLFAEQNIAVEIVNQLDEEKVVEDIVCKHPHRNPKSTSLISPAQRQRWSYRRPVNRRHLVGGQSKDESIANQRQRVRGSITRRMAGMMMLAICRAGSSIRARISNGRSRTSRSSFDALRCELAPRVPPEKASCEAEAEFVADTLALESQGSAGDHARFIAAKREWWARWARLSRQSNFKNDSTWRAYIGRQIPHCGIKRGYRQRLQCFARCLRRR